MDEQKKGTTPHQLNAILNGLYLGYDLYSREEFVRRLLDNQWEVIELACKCYALVEFLNTVDGYTMHVLTCTGNVEGSDRAMEDIERFARKRNAVAVIGLARYGWRSLLESMNYECGSKLFYFRKIL